MCQDRATRRDGSDVGAKVNVRRADPYAGCAVKLASGLNGKIRIQDHLGPWAGTIRRRSKRKRVERKIRKGKAGEQRHNAGSGSQAA